jgi:hypothetical protein
MSAHRDEDSPEMELLHGLCGLVIASVFLPSMATRHPYDERGRMQLDLPLEYTPYLDEVDSCSTLNTTPNGNANGTTKTNRS